MYSSRTFFSLIHWTRRSGIQYYTVSEGIDPLIKLIKSDNPDVREAASMCLANLTNSNGNNCAEVVRVGGIEPVISLLGDTRELAVSNAALLLTNMSTNEQIR